MTAYSAKPQLTPPMLAVGGIMDALTEVEDMTLAFEVLGSLVGDLHPSMEVKHYALGLVIDVLNAEMRRRVALVNSKAAVAADSLRAEP
jgi:hypothetical protein